MNDTERDSVPPPFDEVPSPDLEPESKVRPEDPKSSGASGSWIRFAMIALFVAAIGFGQGLGLTLLFDRNPERLSAHHPDRPEKNSSRPQRQPVEPVESNGAGAPSGEPRQPGRSESAATPHELEIARERFDMGDVEWARRTAAAFLLRMDGLGYEDTRRSSEAYALLADVLRSEYELSQPFGRQEQRAAADGEGEE